MMKTINKVLTLQDVSRETKLILDDYYDELMKWNQTVSLTEVLDRDMYFKRHIHDALQLLDVLPDNKTILDIGSGAGIPGIPLSIMGKHVIMVESVRKKSIFLNHIIKKLSLINSRVINSRVEDLFFDESLVVTARALSELSVLLEYMNSVSRETMGVFLKGKSLPDEIERAEKFWSFDYSLYKSIGDGYIIVVKSLKRK